jgi:hypothetical protein
MQNFLSNHNLFMLRLFLSSLGACIAYTYRHASHDYWLLMLLVFSLIAMAPAYFQFKQSNADSKLLVTQALHWSGGLVAGSIVYAYHVSGRIFHEEAGLIVLLILALTTYLDGVRSGWRSVFTGIFQVLTAISIAYFDDYIWQLIALATLAAVVSHFANSDITLSKHSSHKFL